MQRPQVLGVGRFGATVAGLTATLPDSDAPCEFVAVGISPGGLGATLRMTSRLGCGAIAVGYVGADAVGTLVRSELAAGGIDVLHLLADGPSPLAVSITASDGARRMHSRPSTGAPGPSAADLARTIRQASALAIDGSEPRLQRTAARLARADGIPVIAHLQSLSDAERELITECSVLIVSERVASELAPHGELDDALGEITGMGPPLAVITRGRAGVIARHGSEIVSLPAPTLDALDGTGAGAVFHGGFIAALLSKLGLRDCLDFASTAAALACQSLGPWHGIPSRDALLARMAAT